MQHLPNYLCDQSCGNKLVGNLYYKIQLSPKISTFQSPKDIIELFKII